MTTIPNTRQMRPLSRKDMEDFAKEYEATQLNPAPDEDSATPDQVDPQTPPVVQLSPEEETYKKRFSDASRTIQDNLATIKAQAAESERLKQELADAKAKPLVKPSNVSDEALSKFYADYPEVTPILEAIIDRRAEALADKKVQGFEQQLTEKDKQAIQKMADLQKLQKAHPDYTEFEKDGSIFLEWLDKQSPAIKRFADYSQTQDIDTVIGVLDMFKAQVQVNNKPSGQNRKPISSNPASNSPIDIPASKTAFDAAKWDKDMDKAFSSNNKALQEKLMAQLHEAKANGLISY